MSYATLESQLKLLPEDCLDEVAKYVDFILFRRNKTKTQTEKTDLSQFFGSIKNLPDGLEMQRSMRDEWD
jgi:hypothetical protein